MGVRAASTAGSSPKVALTVFWGALVAAPLAGLVHPAWWLVLASVVGAVLLAALRLSRWVLAHAALLAALSMAAAGSGLFGAWPLPLVVALLLYFGITAITPALASTRDWMHWQRAAPDRNTRLLFTVTVVASIGALAAYAWIVQPDVSDAFTGLAGRPWWVIALAGVAFVAVNPSVEEALYRGVLYRALESETGNSGLAVVAQGVAFGVLHVAGFPGGFVGVVLAGTWGTVLGVLRMRTGGLKWSWWAHFVANVVIFLAAVLLAVDQAVL